MASGVMGPSAREMLLLEKATYGNYRPFRGGVHTHHGNVFEPVAKLIHCHRNRTTIHDFGLIEHAQIHYLGASTDGVTAELMNVEIKSLNRRIIDGKIKKEYYHQMQHQMECLGLKESVFIEGVYESYASADTFYEDFQINDREKGAIIECFNIAHDELEYFYSPVTLSFDKNGLQEWVTDECQRISQEDNIVYVRELYWVLTEITSITVPKDQSWLSTHSQAFREFWDDVLYYRSNPEALEALILSREQRVNQKKSTRKSKVDPDDHQILDCHL
jgi:hypothetical protein